ncbi:Rod binding protein [Anatilimnocola aggregata]|uniref:Rod binding protein n=1 Tax=Anatilimnocola aggregata TaxID=2528021 RepID=A0A517YKU3_9BACT|nr:rod-binding protein [Anatilimnocola aggregata]QDU30846.1 Rod binding protein [Anatilimnocola aggregata]
MQINAATLTMAGPRGEAPTGLMAKTTSHDEAREAFTDFVGQTMFGQALSSMRKTVEKSEYFHGGRAEEVFQGQLDQILAEELTEASADSFAGPMFDMFMLHRS